MRARNSLLLIFFFFSLTTMASNLSDFSGKYKADFEGVFSQDSVEFLISPMGKIKIISYHGDESLGRPEIHFNIATFNNQLGPTTLPIASLMFTVGSDEETHAFILRLAVISQGGEQKQIRLIDSIYTINDGPNDVTSVEVGHAKLFRWNTKEKKYEDLR